MTPVQAEIIMQLYRGIKVAEAHGVRCAMSGAVLIDGKWLHWPYAVYRAGLLQEKKP